jgi:hydroxylamine reductase
MTMFCYQCEQTTKGTGCTTTGVCGKNPAVAALQDLLVLACKATSMYAHRARQLGHADADVDVAVMEALFTTVTNVNFDPQRLAHLLRQAAAARDRARALYLTACASQGRHPETLGAPATWVPGTDLDGLVRQGEEVSPATSIRGLGADLAGLQELLLYGLKGTAAYAHHAWVLGKQDDAFFAFMHEALDLLTQPRPTVATLFDAAMRCGQVNLKVMELLDSANTGAYGHPVPTPVRVSAVKGKAILVSGHDLKDLEEVLKQTAGLGINIYTHGEMLPAHGYPHLKKYPHLAGNYGGAWQDQREEFDRFPGAVLMTTNCIQQPRDTYQARIFTSGLVAWPGVTHITGHDFKPLIDAALAAPGFPGDDPEKTILVGFGHQAILGVADQVVGAVKSGALRRFFLVGGCDGARPGRDYFTEFAEAVPQDCVILTLACGKYRFNKLDFGTVGGIPRLLDCGQCNDAYSAIKVAGALAQAFSCSVQDLPLSMVLSWYEQKAVAILLTLLHLGIRNIRLGPSLPAFVSPAVLDVLVDKFAIKPTTTVERDLEAALAGA